MFKSLVTYFTTYLNIYVHNYRIKEDISKYIACYIRMRYVNIR